MTRDEMAQWKEHQDRLYAMAVDDGETWDLSVNDKAACNAGGDAILALLRATPAPVAAPPADLVALVRRVVDEFTEYEVPDDIRGVAPRVADALRDLAAFPLPEVPK